LYKSELNFLIQLCLSYLSCIEKDIIVLKNNEFSNFSLLNRNLKNIDFTLKSINFYLKRFFFKLIVLKKKFNYKNIYKKNNYIKNNYIKNYLYKNSYFKKLNLSCSSNYMYGNYICSNCACLSSTLDYGNKIIYYQNFLKLKFIDKNILKFNFIFCNLCNKYKISLKDNEFILSFYTYDEIIKHFIKIKKFDNFIFFNNKIQYCVFYYMTNYVFFDDLKFINLNLNNYDLIFFYCYLKNKDKSYFNIKSHLLNFKFYNVFLYLIMLLLLNVFFIENYTLLIPTIVIMYNNTIQLTNEGLSYNKKIEALKDYQKKNKIIVTKKIKKERKLFYLNKFFNDFKKKK